MVLCRTQYARSQRLRRVKAVTATALAASLAFAVYALLTSPSEVDSQPIAADAESATDAAVVPVTPAPYPASAGDRSRASDGLAFGLPGNKDELRRIDGKIEELQQRMLKAKMLPNIGL
jgi:hypothetical protein